MIKLICVGKIKESYWKDAISEYVKRLSKYTKLEIIECNDYSGYDENTILEKERQEIVKYIHEKDYICTLEIEGKSCNSLTFSSFIENTLMNYGNITFIIGGSYGIHSDIKKMSNSHLSFSQMTFPHQLFRVLLLEQIYRAFKIQNHETYHK